MHLDLIMKSKEIDVGIYLETFKSLVERLEVIVFGKVMENSKTNEKISEK